MQEYLAPLDDMNFVIQEHLGFDALTQLSGAEDVSSDLVASILSEAGKLARDVLSPLNRSGDQTGLQINEDAQVTTPSGFADAYRQYADGGWGSLQFDPEYGGRGLPFSLAIPVQEMWHAANMAWGLCPLLTQGAIEAIEANASDALKRQYLPEMISGNWTGTMNLTEPQSGSDMATLRTRAEPCGDHYKIFGQKIFITWGEHDMAENIIHLVLARLPDAPPGVKGISLFLVPKFLPSTDLTQSTRNDCHVMSLEHKIGVHASPTCVMSYGDNGGAVGFLISQEHRGLACMFSMMNNARLTVGLQGVAISERAYQLARDYALERSQGVAPGRTAIGPIIRHPDVRRMLLSMRSLTEASRALTYTACFNVDHRNKHPDADVRAFHHARSALLTPIVKGWCTEVAQEVTSLGVQIHGGMGFIEESGAGQYFRDARILPIYEGTNGIQAADLAERKTRGDSGRAMDLLIQEMRDVIHCAQGLGEPIISLADAFAASVVALNSAKDILLTKSEIDINFGPATSSNYLMLAGTVCGGWQMLIAAIAANTQLNNGAKNSFYNSKILVAQFYMANILPRYLSYAAAINAGSAAVMALPENQF